MADIVVTAASVALTQPDPMKGTIIVTRIAAAAVTAGQATYVTSTGKAGVCDADVSGKEQFRGIALQTVGTDQAVDILQQGCVEGFTLDAIAYDALVYASDTAGSLGTTAGTKTVAVGRVVPTTNKDSSGNMKKLLYVSAAMTSNW